MTQSAIFHGEARNRVIAGVNNLANAVRVTPGPRGRNVSIDLSFGASIGETAH